MRVELRLTTDDHLQDAVTAPVDAVGIGQEGCPHRLPSLPEIRRAARVIRDAGHDFSVVLPQAWERFAAEMLDVAVRVAAEGPVTLVVNDMGTLVGLAEAALPAHVTVAVGQGLVYGYAQSPLADRWLSAEAPERVGQLAAANITDGATLDILTGLGVTAVELDAATAAATDPTSLTRRGFLIRTIADAAVVGISRACPVARHHGVEASQNCRQLCDAGVYRLQATSSWRLVDGHRDAMSKSAREAAGTLLVSGNIVYRRIDAAPPAHADVVVVDARWHAGGDLESAIATARGDVTADALSSSSGG